MANRPAGGEGPQSNGIAPVCILHVILVVTHVSSLLSAKYNMSNLNNQFLPSLQHTDNQPLF